jgi:Tfp pilus assembly protein PilO
MAIVGVIVIVSFYFLQIQKYAGYNNEIVRLKIAVEKLNKIENNQSDFDNKKNKVLAGLNVVNKKIPVKPLIPQSIEEITKPMDEFGVSLISITPLESVKRGEQSDNSFQGGLTTVDVGTAMSGITDMPSSIQDDSRISGGRYIETPIELVLHATYKQFGMYLNALRHLDRLIIIDGFEVESDKTISPKVNIKLKLSVFHYAKE